MSQRLISEQSIPTADSYKSKTLNTQNNKDSEAGAPIHRLKGVLQVQAVIYSTKHKES